MTPFAAAAAAELIVVIAIIMAAATLVNVGPIIAIVLNWMG